jgi:hypothetical protein
MTSSGRRCDRTGCSRDAFWAPVLRVFAPERYGDVHVDVMVDLALCDACKEEISIEDVLSDDGWSKIVGTFVSRGMVRPKRDRTVMIFVPLERSTSAFATFKPN